MFDLATKETADAKQQSQKEKEGAADFVWRPSVRPARGL